MTTKATAGPVSLKSVLGLSKISRTSIRNAARQSEIIRRKIIKPSHEIANQPPFLCIFESLAHLEVWLFCSRTGTSLSDWITEYNEMWKRKPNHLWLTPPKLHQIEEDDAAFSRYFEEINAAVITDREKLRASCGICHGTGLAWLMRGPLLLHDTPGPLGMRPCWCR